MTFMSDFDAGLLSFTSYNDSMSIITILSVIVILQILNCSMMIIPDDMLSREIFKYLGPLSLIRIGLTTQQLSPTADIAMNSLFKKQIKGSYAYDIEKLYEYYICIHHDQTEEAEAVKRLTMLNIPERIDGKYQLILDEYRSSLFTSNSVRVPQIATNRFSELCVLIFKHKTFEQKKNIAFVQRYQRTRWREQFIEGALPSFASLKWRSNWIECALSCAPESALKVIRQMKGKPEHVDGVLKEGIDSLLHHTCDISVNELYLVCALTTTANLKTSMGIIRSANTKNVNKIFPWLIKFGTSKLVSHLLRNFPLSCSQSTIVMLIAEAGRSLQLYRALLGDEKYESTRHFIESFDFEKGRFKLSQDKELPYNTILEAALMFGCPYEVFEALIRRKGYRSNASLIFLALVRNAEHRIIYILLECLEGSRLIEPVFCYNYGTKDHDKWLRVPISPTVFQVFTIVPKRKRKSWKMPDVMKNIAMLAMLATKQTLNFSLFENLLNRLPNSRKYRSIVLTALINNIWKTPNPKATYRALKTYAFENEVVLELSPDIGYFHRLEDITFDRPVHIMLETIPKDLYAMPNTVNNIVLDAFPAHYANQVLMSVNGHEALMGHFDEKFYFWLSLLLLRNWRIDYKAMAVSIADSRNPTRFVEMVLGLTKRGEYYVELELLFDKIVENAELPGMLHFVADMIQNLKFKTFSMINSSIVHNLSSKQLCKLPAIIAEQCKNQGRSSQSIERNRLASILFIFRQLVANGKITSPEDLHTKYAEIEDFMPYQDAIEISALITEIRDEQESASSSND